MKKCFGGIYNGLKVLVTGNTGFKGSWLTLWLHTLGADVIGYSLEPPTSPSLFEACRLADQITHIHGDVRDYTHLHNTILNHRPDIIFHLAAQPLVLASYQSPRETFETNVQGSINLLEAVRQCPTVQAVVMVTTDKVYENKNWLWGYRENDQLGCGDPYSTSKAMAEMVIESYRRSFFQQPNNATAIASARAGNVIGGGDFSENRLLPDIVRALSRRQPILLRNPASVRPWMHVLDPLSGYLRLGEKLIESPQTHTEAWNFGPQEQQMVTCLAIVKKSIDIWGEGDWYEAVDYRSQNEMQLLQLDSSKALKRLHWLPCYDWTKALEETIAWFKSFHQKPSHEKVYNTCLQQIEDYTSTALELNQPWAGQITSLIP